ERSGGVLGRSAGEGGPARARRAMARDPAGVSAVARRGARLRIRSAALAGGRARALPRLPGRRRREAAALRRGREDLLCLGDGPCGPAPATDMTSELERLNALP